MPANPFSFGDLALDDAFTDRVDEVASLRADILNGQNVVVFAPRRYGKTSLVWRTVQEVVREDVLVAQVDLMKTPTKERLAARLAKSIHEDIASRLFRAREQLRVFASLRVTPIINVNPQTGGTSFSFSFSSAHREEDVDATIERLLELPAQLAAERGRRAAVVFDEFQEIVEIDRKLPALMRAVFQEQPDVAHVYLGSKRHMMERLFNDEHEPFWRSAKQMELGPIATPLFADFVRERFHATGKTASDEAVELLLGVTRGHPYGTQELAYALWEAVEPGGTASVAHFEAALASVLRSEHAHFARIWEKAAKGQRLVLLALARERGFVLGTDYRGRHALGAASSVQRAVETLVADELVARDRDGYRISEPFLAEWIVRNEL